MESRGKVHILSRDTENGTKALTDMDIDSMKPMETKVGKA